MQPHLGAPKVAMVAWSHSRQEGRLCKPVEARVGKEVCGRHGDATRGRGRQEQVNVSESTRIRSSSARSDCRSVRRRKNVTRDGVFGCTKHRLLMSCSLSHPGALECGD